MLLALSWRVIGVKPRSDNLAHNNISHSHIILMLLLVEFFRLQKGSPTVLCVLSLFLVCYT